jgi:hypothetical protein
LFYLSLTELAQAELVLSAIKPSSDRTPMAAFAFLLTGFKYAVSARFPVHNSHRVRESRHRSATHGGGFFVFCSYLAFD